MMTNNTKLENKLAESENLWECFSYLKKHDLENYVKEEAEYLEGDEDKAQEGFSEIQEDYFHIH